MEREEREKRKRERVERKEKQREERKESEKEKKGREKEREEGRTVRSSSDLRRSDDWSAMGQELKFIYATRATLQEVGILPTLVYFHPKGLFVFRFWD